MAMDSLELHELNAKSAGIGAWVLKVHGMRLTAYEYTWNQKPQKGYKLECLLVAADGTYCPGLIKAVYRRTTDGGSADPVDELKTQMQKFSDGTIWRMTKVTLAAEKGEYIGSPLKKCIDVRKTTCAPILQGIVQMPPAPAPEESLESILALPNRQRVDLTALIADMSPVRRETTCNGVKDITDITLVDGSKADGVDEQVKAKLSVFFHTSGKEAALLKSMQDACATNAPVALYGLTCTPLGGGICEFKSSQSFFWEIASGTYAKLTRLQMEANEMVAAPSSLIAKEWQPTQRARDFAAEAAVHAVCGWIAALLRPSADGGAKEPTEPIPEGTDDVFQINHCFVDVPGPGEQLLTKDGDRLWLQNIRVMDTTGSFTVAIREKAALALSGYQSRDAFQEANANDNVSFPVLASVRIHFARRKTLHESPTQEGGATEPASLTAVMVEAEDQDMEMMPTRALLELQPILKSLALSTQELVITCLKDIEVLPHVGMVVGGVKCELALVLVAATARSEFQRFGSGYRLITKNVLDVGFGASALKPDDSSASGAKEPTGMDLVAICTEHNLTEYKMAPSRKGDVQHALLVISGVRHMKPPHDIVSGAEEPNRKSFMVERLQLVEGAGNVLACQKMLGKLKHARGEFAFEGTKRDRSAWDEQAMTPVSSAKKVRRLSETPTGGSLPDEP